ncbi:MAG: hypothetical protein ISS52_02965 [Dehalococcoidia bacterium]|nr:hypothetical protein [Dehalococcoidia bacterium]
MPNESNEVGERVTEVLIAPLGELLKHVGRAIAEAQRALDENSIATEVELADKREELGYDLHATWYHLPETNIEIKMSVSMHWEEEEEKEEGKPVVWKPVLYAAPLNASYKSLFDYEAAGTSVLRAKVVCIPPPVMIEGA